MRGFAGKVLILLGIALAFGNARCFALCLADSCDSASHHCHPAGKARRGECARQHDLRAPAIHQVAPPAQAVVAVIEMQAPGITWMLDPTPSPDASPPESSLSALLPLRI